MFYEEAKDVFKNEDIYFNAAKWLTDREYKYGTELVIHSAFFLTDGIDKLISENNIRVTVYRKDEIEINKNEPEIKDGITLYWHQEDDVAAFEYGERVVLLTRMLGY